MKQLLVILTLTTIITAACNREEIDQEKPEIILHTENTFPNYCDTLWLGESFTLKLQFTDNHELGSYSIEIHENFDHHSHSTEAEFCQLLPEKDPVNPFEFLQDYTIPEGQTYYEVSKDIMIPDGNFDGLYDEGDYDINISLTDREGWANQRVISIKLMRR